jgi:hypothetical protein
MVFIDEVVQKYVAYFLVCKFRDVFLFLGYYFLLFFFLITETQRGGLGHQSIYPDAQAYVPLKPY